jgi:hypothetical protein
VQFAQQERLPRSAQSAQNRPAKDKNAPPASAMRVLLEIYAHFVIASRSAAGDMGGAMLDGIRIERQDAKTPRKEGRGLSRGFSRMTRINCAPVLIRVICVNPWLNSSSLPSVPWRFGDLAFIPKSTSAVRALAQTNPTRVPGCSKTFALDLSPVDACLPVLRSAPLRTRCIIKSKCAKQTHAFLQIACGY